jgi:membrane-associated phospholipid phosphatase
LKNNRVAAIAGLIISILFRTAVVNAAEAVSMPYRLSMTTDAVLLSLGTAVASASICVIATRPAPGRWETIMARKSQVNSWDRIATATHLRGAETASTVLLGTMAAAPLVMQLCCLAGNENRKALALFVMYAEVMIMDIGVNNMARGLVYRKRPCLYNENIFDRKPRSRESSMSFYSIHTSIAFSSAAFLGTVFSDTYGDSPYQYLVWAGAISAAGITGYLRVASGRHFPTDVIAGAVAGSLIGCIVPILHRVRKDGVSILLMSGRSNGLSFMMTF